MSTLKIKKMGLAIMQISFLVLFVTLLLPSLSNQPKEGLENNSLIQEIPAESKVEIDALGKRVMGMDICFSPRITPSVRKVITDYTTFGKLGTARIIGRSATYFPIFNRYLEELDLPSDLKYLAVVESKLKVEANSPVGAKGLWQFMPTTASIYGLEINDDVDQRLDPFLSTEAALTYLKELHGRFDDWGLAIAAYNCGPGRLNKAIRSSGIDVKVDFWDIKQYLPKETQAYVQTFIGLQYVMEHYPLHNLKPKYPSAELADIEPVVLTESYTFDQIAAESGVDVSIIEELNPTYLTGYIPANENGYVVALPKSANSLYDAGTFAYSKFVNQSPTL